MEKTQWKYILSKSTEPPLHGNLPVYFSRMEEAGEEEDKDKRKKEEEKSGQTNYYVHCRWNMSPFSAGATSSKMFSFQIFVYFSLLS